MKLQQILDSEILAKMEPEETAQSLKRRSVGDWLSRQRRQAAEGRSMGTDGIRYIGDRKALRCVRSLVDPVEKFVNAKTDHEKPRMPLVYDKRLANNDCLRQTLAAGRLRVNVASVPVYTGG